MTEKPSASEYRRIVRALGLFDQPTILLTALAEYDLSPMVRRGCYYVLASKHNMHFITLGI